jgi:hypothetical protein
MPLTGVGTVVAPLTPRMMFRFRESTLLPILITRALLVFLVGHNFAILGLVDITTEQAYRVLEFVGSTVFPSAAFAVSTWS